MIPANELIVVHVRATTVPPNWLIRWGTAGSVVNGALETDSPVLAPEWEASFT